MRRFVVNLSSVESLNDFVQALNIGFCNHVGGHFDQINLDAFHDYLSWPEEENYELVFLGWHDIGDILREVHPYSGKSYAHNFQDIFDHNLLSRHHPHCTWSNAGWRRSAPSASPR